jgi:hypothetical protein
VLASPIGSIIFIYLVSSENVYLILQTLHACL